MKKIVILIAISFGYGSPNYVKINHPYKARYERCIQEKNKLYNKCYHPMDNIKYQSLGEYSRQNKEIKRLREEIRRLKNRKCDKESYENREALKAFKIQITDQ